MQHVTPGHVYIVGAGPGDPELLTLKAHRLLSNAAILAYDKLIPDAILDLAPQDCEMLCVGRRCGAGVLPYAVHPQVLDAARAGRDVLRLKCGDPMVFGRGGEEIEVLERNGIPYSVVPGITAALGAASGSGIPLTLRDISSSVTFATGHSVLDGYCDTCNWPELARSGGTLVLYMAARTLAENTARLISGGCPPEMPAAFIARASQPDQEIIRGDLATIAELVPPTLMGAPGIVIIGRVVDPAIFLAQAPQLSAVS